jgi:hypothetical protein
MIIHRMIDGFSVEGVLTCEKGEWILRGMTVDEFNNVRYTRPGELNVYRNDIPYKVKEDEELMSGKEV